MGRGLLCDGIGPGQGWSFPWDRAGPFWDRAGPTLRVEQKRREMGKTGIETALTRVRARL